MDENYFITTRGQALMDTMTHSLYLSAHLKELGRSLYIFIESPERVPPWVIQNLVREGFLTRDVISDQVRQLLWIRRN